MAAIVSTNIIGTGHQSTPVGGDSIDLLPGVTIASTNDVAIDSTTTSNAPMSFFIGGSVVGTDAVFLDATDAVAYLTVAASGSLVGNAGDGWANLGTDRVDNYGLITGTYNGAEVGSSIFYNYGGISGSANDGIQVDTQINLTNSGNISGFNGVAIGSSGSGLTDTIINSGQINGDAGIDIEAANCDVNIENSGTIGRAPSGDYSISDYNTGTITISNSQSGVLNGVVSTNNGSLTNQGALYGNFLGQIVVNSGVINGIVYLSGVVSAFENTGEITGNIDLSNTNSTFDNSGTIDGSVYDYGASFTDTGTIEGTVTQYGNGSFTVDDNIGQNAVIVDASGAEAIQIYQGPFAIDNSGEVGGISVDYDDGLHSGVAGQGSIVNHGRIADTSANGFAIFIADTASADTDTIVNTGAMDASATQGVGVDSEGASALDVTNQGSITAYYGIDALGAAAIDNSGTIKGVEALFNDASAAGATDYLFNSGSIVGDIEGVYDTGGHTARIVNAGDISVGTSSADAAVYADGSTQERLVNSGTISGAVSLGAANSTIVNSGAIDGNINFGGGSGRLVNSGSIDGSVTFSGAGNVYLGQGGSFTGTVTGASADDKFYGGAGDEYFDLTGAGAKVAVGGTGATTFDYGADFTNAMAVSGGAGTTVVDLEGNYAGASELFLGARTMVGVSKLTLGAGFNYAIVANASTVANGQTMTVDGSALGSANTLLFDASHDVGGFYDFIGGAGQNTFTFATYNLFANDVVQAGSGASNILRFITAGNVSSQQFANVTGIATIKLQAGTNDIQLNDFMVTKASGHALTVNLNTGDDTIDASLLTTASNSVTLNAANASAGDTFNFGAAKETVDLSSAPNSTSADYDTISNFNFTAGDAVNVAGFTPVAALSAINGSLSAATFDSDLASQLTSLAKGDAVVFNATSGGLAGESFLIAATNGANGYAAGDLVIRLTGTTTGTLGVGNL